MSKHPPKKPVDELPNRIRYHRKARGWNLGDLASKIGCTEAMLSSLERGTRNLTVEWMRRIAPRLDVTPADLLAAGDNPLAMDAQIAGVVGAMQNMDGRGRDAVARLAESQINYRSGPKN